MLLVTIHPFSSLFSGITLVSQHQKVNPFWILMKQRDDVVAVTSAWPYANHLLLTLYRKQCHHLISYHSIFYGPDALHDALPTVSMH